MNEFEIELIYKMFNGIFLKSGEKLSLDGQHTLAVDAWKKEIQNMTGVYKMKVDTCSVDVAIVTELKM